MEDLEQLTQRCCLLRFTRKCWQGTKALPKNIIERIGNAEYLTGSKRLVDRELIKKPMNIISATEKYLDSKDVKFPFVGIRAIGKERLGDVSSGLENFEKLFNEAVTEVKYTYEAAKEKARPILEADNLYNEEDYPHTLDRFYLFKWQFFNIGTPNPSIVTPEMYQQEVDNLRETWEQARELTAMALRVELSKLIESLMERIGNGEPKIFRDSLVWNFHEFFSDVDSRNIFGDKELEVLVSKAKDVLQNVTPEKLREYQDVRARVTSSIGALKNELLSSITDLPRRSIAFKRAA